MKQLLKYLLIVSISFNVVAQNTTVSIDAKIDDNLLLTASIEYSFSQVKDSIKIYKLSSGVNPNKVPNISIKNISSKGQKVNFDESNEWLILKDPKRLNHVAIEYQLDLNAIYDWRKSYEYSIFPSTYEDKCWYPDLYANGKRDFYKDFEVTIQHPERLQLTTSGYLASEKIASDGNLQSEFSSKNIRYFGLNAAFDFARKTLSNNGISIQYFCPKKMESTYALVTKTAMEAVQWYSEIYGFFPKQQMNIAIGHPTWHGGFPSENMFYIHQGNLETSFIQWITAHELGHYYWGLHTLSATEDELSPLMLSNGIWIDHLYLSNAYKKPLVEIWNTYTPQAAMFEKFLATYLSNFEQEIGFLRSEQNFGFDYNSNVAHAKAAVGFYLISNLIGKDNYLQLQKEILIDYKGKSFSFEDFKNELEEKGYSYSKRFIEQWYRDHAFIEYAIYKVEVSEENQQWKYAFELRKKGTVDFPVDIRIIDDSGQRYDLVSDGSSQKQFFEGYTKTKPVHFLLDVDGKLPMWNSDNEAIQKAYIFALYRAGKLKLANKLAKETLQNADDQRLRQYYETFKY